MLLRLRNVGILGGDYSFGWKDYCLKACFVV